MDGAGQEPGFLDLIFELAGSGRGHGRASRARLWSAIVMAMAGVLALFGAYLTLRSLPTALTAAKLEDGYQPSVRRPYVRGRWQPNPYEVAGKPGDIDAILFRRGGAPWRCVPIASDRSGDRPPRVYYAASEAHYLRARAAGRFVGDLYDGAEAPLWRQHEEVRRAVPADAYLLIDDGWQAANGESGRSLLIIAGVIGVLAATVFARSLRRSA